MRVRHGKSTRERNDAKDAGRARKEKEQDRRPGQYKYRTRREETAEREQTQTYGYKGRSIIQAGNTKNAGGREGKQKSWAGTAEGESARKERGKGDARANLRGGR